MAEHVVFLLDNDKDFLNLYSKLLQSKGCQVFATDNLFLLLKYAKTVLPEWIFIDENFAPEHEKELVKIIDKSLPVHHTHFAVMGERRGKASADTDQGFEFVYKPAVLEKMMEITKNSCNLH